MLYRRTARRSRPEAVISLDVDRVGRHRRLGDACMPSRSSACAWWQVGWSPSTGGANAGRQPSGRYGPARRRSQAAPRRPQRRDRPTRSGAIHRARDAQGKLPAGGRPPLGARRGPGRFGPAAGAPACAPRAGSPGIGGGVGAARPGRGWSGSGERRGHAVQSFRRCAGAGRGPIRPDRPRQPGLSPRGPLASGCADAAATGASGPQPRGATGRDAPGPGCCCTPGQAGIIAGYGGGYSLPATGRYPMHARARASSSRGPSRAGATGNTCRWRPLETRFIGGGIGAGSPRAAMSGSRPRSTASRPTGRLLDGATEMEDTAI